MMIGFPFEKNVAGEQLFFASMQIRTRNVICAVNRLRMRERLVGSHQFRPVAASGVHWFHID